jgi:CheY-like chemotaxis protein
VEDLMAHSGGQELRPAEIDLGRVVTAIEPMLRRLLGDRIELVVSATPGVWPIVADRRGHSFTIYLPRSTQTGGVEEQRPSPTPGVKPRHETILVAEDEAVVRDMVVASLERLGYQVMAASTGEEAVRLIDRLDDDIDLLLSDVVMPGMSGPDLLDRARRTRPELRAVFMTGYTALSVGRPIQTGVTLLEKPFSSTRLGEVVRAVLAAG